MSELGEKTGSFDGLNWRTRCGCRPWERQIRRTELTLLPVVLAIAAAQHVIRTRQTLLLRAVPIGHDRRKPQAILTIHVHHDPFAHLQDSHAHEPSGILKRGEWRRCGPNEVAAGRTSLPPDSLMP